MSRTTQEDQHYEAAMLARRLTGEVSELKEQAGRLAGALKGAIAKVDNYDMWTPDEMASFIEGWRKELAAWKEGWA